MDLSVVILSSKIGFRLIRVRQWHIGSHVELRQSEILAATVLPLHAFMYELEMPSVQVYYPGFYEVKQKKREAYTRTTWTRV